MSAKLMMEYIESEGIEVIYMDFRGDLKGLYADGCIAVDEKADEFERAGIIAEELGHHFTSAGNILDQTKLEARKQEKVARRWGHSTLISLAEIAAGAIECEGLERWELAEHLGVTDEYLCEAIKEYQERYGLFKELPGCCIFFEPLTVATYAFD